MPTHLPTHTPAWFLEALVHVAAEGRTPRPLMIAFTFFFALPSINGDALTILCSVQTQTKMEEWTIGNVRAALEKGRVNSIVPEQEDMQ